MKTEQDWQNEIDAEKETTGSDTVERRVMLCGDLPLRKKSKEYMKQFSIDNLCGELLSRRLGYEDGYAACLRDNGLIKD